MYTYILFYAFQPQQQQQQQQQPPLPAISPAAAGSLVPAHGQSASPAAAAHGASGALLAPQPPLENGVPVSISHVTSADDFYLQMRDDVSALQLRQLLLELNAECDSDVSAYEPRVGELLAVNSRRRYCRGRVVAVNSTRQMADIFFVDYGHTEAVVFEQLQPLPAACAAPPPFAYRCCLRGIQGTNPDGGFSRAAIAWFKAEVTDEDVTRNLQCDVTLVYEGGDGDGQKHAVDLNSHGRSVCKTMQKQKYATPLTGSQTPPEQAPVPVVSCADASRSRSRPHYMYMF